MTTEWTTIVRGSATVSWRLPDGTTVVVRNEVVADWTRMRNEWILIREGTARSWEVGHAIYSGGELHELLRQAGFASVSLFGDLDGNVYGPDASRLVAVARKTGS